VASCLVGVSDRQHIGIEVQTADEIGICTIGEGLTRSYGGLLACRFLVGMFEAGFVPCMPPLEFPSRD